MSEQQQCEAPRVFLHLSISPFRLISFSFRCLETLLLFVYTFRILVTMANRSLWCYMSCFKPLPQGQKIFCLFCCCSGSLPMALDLLFYFHHLVEKEMATHSSNFALKIPWMEEPRGLPSMGKSWTRPSDFTFTFHHLKDFFLKCLFGCIGS